MAASATLIVDVGTVITSGPNAATAAAASAAAGPIMDYVGNCLLARLKLKEASVLLTQVKAATDSSDSTNLTLVNGVLATLNGTASPTVVAITDIGTVITNGPNAATLAKSSAAAGPILDWVGNLHLVRLKLKETLMLIKSIIAVTDASDSANKTLLQNVNLALA
jgi:hypothetical protein